MASIILGIFAILYNGRRESFFFVRMQFFPKTEKYLALFTGSDDSDTVDRRNKLRKQIKANLIAAAASGKDLEGGFFSISSNVLFHIFVLIYIYIFFFFAL